MDTNLVVTIANRMVQILILNCVSFHNNIDACRQITCPPGSTKCEYFGSYTGNSDNAKINYKCIAKNGIIITYDNC